MSLSCITIFSLAILAATASGCAKTEQQADREDTLTDVEVTGLATPSPNIVTRTNSIEAQTLKRIVVQLEELGNLVKESEHYANPDARIKFDYQRLRYDLSQIVNGINSHVNRPVYMPRSIAPIAGNYRRGLH